MIARNAKRIFQFAADGKDGRHGEWEFDRKWRVTPRAADGQFASRENTHHRIVGADVNVAVVQEKGIGQRGEPRQCLVVARGDGFFGKIAAGHYQRMNDE